MNVARLSIMCHFGSGISSLALSHSSNAGDAPLLKSAMTRQALVRYLHVQCSF